MKEMKSKADAYTTGVLSMFKDLWNHSYKDNIALQHSMSTYVERCVPSLQIASDADVDLCPR